MVLPWGHTTPRFWAAQSYKSPVKGLFAGNKELFSGRNCREYAFCREETRSGGKMISYVLNFGIM
jgi:hypothetical protein